MSTKRSQCRRSGAMKNITALAIAMLVFPVAAAALPPSVDLDRPGAIEALARHNPAHHAKIERIVADVQRKPPEAVARWMKAEFGAEQVSFPPLLMTSDPARRSLSFTLDDTRYELTLQVRARWSFTR